MITPALDHQKDTSFQQSLQKASITKQPENKFQRARKTSKQLEKGRLNASRPSEISLDNDVPMTSESQGDSGIAASLELQTGHYSSLFDRLLIVI